ncbi:MAG TPA: LuxR C-terminal-related transcriptional regulator [Gaiellaceae bacterium]|nr:LuxR C-terminal-related transcriptional regulator [Gaiellaceae bacterium]
MVVDAPPSAAPFLTLISQQLPPALEEISVPCYVIDATGHIRWLNDAAKELVGDATGKMFTSVLDPHELPRAKSLFQRNLHGKGHRDFAVDLLNVDGEEQCVEISSVPLRSKHRAIGMFGVVRPRSDAPERPPKVDGRLTPRQREILRLLADGRSTEQIAAALHISRETVRNHVRHISKRLGTKSRLQAVAVARRDEII